MKFALVCAALLVASTVGALASPSYPVWSGAPIVAPGDDYAKGHDWHGVSGNPSNHDQNPTSGGSSGGNGNPSNHDRT